MGIAAPVFLPVTRAGSDVLLVAELFPPAIGGSAVLLENIYARLGPPVTVVTDSTGDGRAALCQDSFRMIRVPMTAPEWGVLHPRSLVRHIRVASRLAIEAQGRTAIVHCARALPEGLAALLARQFCGGLRYLCWTHGEELDYVRTSRELTALQARVHRHASAILANSRNTARKLEVLGIPPAKVNVVYPGVDADRFAKNASRHLLRQRLAPNGELVLLTVGRLQRRKGQDLVIKALNVLRNDFPGMRYVVVGSGDERARLDQLARDLSLRDRIDFVGVVAPDELPAYYAAADIFVHPNRVDESEVEGFGIVFLEAAAAGLPTIGGNSGGVPEALEPGVTGMLVESDNVSELAEAIRTLALSEVLRRQMGNAGRGRVRRQFTWERAAAEVAAVHGALEASA